MWGCVWVWCGGIYGRAEVTYDEIIDSDYHSEISFGLNKNKYAANALLEDEKRKNMAALYKQFENHLGLESQFSPKKPETPKFVAKRGFHFAYLLIAAVWFLLQSIVLLSASTTNPSAYFIDTILYTGHGLSLLSSFFLLPSFLLYFPSLLFYYPLLSLSPPPFCTSAFYHRFSLSHLPLLLLCPMHSVPVPIYSPFCTAIGGTIRRGKGNLDARREEKKERKEGENDGYK